MNTLFVGAPNSTATPFCAAYAMLVYSFGHSGMIALLPLSIDRAVAVILPVRHSTIITKRSCLIMFAVTWLAILAVLIESVVSYNDGTISIEYSDGYHRCVMLEKGLVIQIIFLFIIPFFFVLLAYTLMLAIILKTKRSFGHFLAVSAVIITTNLLAYTPSVILDIDTDIEIGYEVSQIIFATFWYINGVANPLIYVAAHPKTKKYFRLCWQRKNRPVGHSTVELGGVELADRARRSSRVSATLPDYFTARDTIDLPNTNV